MSHAGENFLKVPAHLSLEPADQDDGAALGLVRLPVHGQGTIGFAIAEPEPFSVVVQSMDWGMHALRWDVDADGATLHEYITGDWRPLATFPAFNREADVPNGIDPDPDCIYWFSIDYNNYMLRYGKGEMRLDCVLLEFDLHASPYAVGKNPYVWLGKARHLEVTAAVKGRVDIWRDPVTVKVPMSVVPSAVMTMERMAQGDETVPANLTPTCRQLYDNVAGPMFTLDTDDFPQFAEAIAESIVAEDGWCYKTLEAKASEFGERDPDRTYLRITLGQNQGDSPGVPFVMEIWPAGHYSPIHNHGGAEAVIKVLHGEINVELYRMLSPHHQTPYTTAVFGKGDVAWISSRLNQVHKLHNRGASDPCVTIQCYLYADTNEAHWPYFDYLAKAEIAHFSPNSDCGFTEFKAIMKEEWLARHPVLPPAAG